MIYHHQRGVIAPFFQKYYRLIALAVAGVFVLTQFTWLMNLADATGGGNSHEEIVITGDTTDGLSPGWMFNRDTDTDTPIEFNYNAKKIGDGSLEVLPIGSNPDDKFIGELFMNREIKDVKSFEYWFKINGAPSDANEFYLNVYTWFDSNPDWYDCRFDYVPEDNGSTDWRKFKVDMDDTADAVKEKVAGTCPDSPADMPAGSHLFFFSISTGDSSASDEGVGGHFDKVIVKTKKENNKKHTVTYDFEPISYTNENGKLNICHFDDNEGQYVLEQIKLKKVKKHKDHEGDLIPPNPKTPDGVNWTEENIEIWENNCEDGEVGGVNTEHCTYEWLLANTSGGDVKKRLQELQVTGEACFDVEVVQECGYLNVLPNDIVRKNEETDDYHYGAWHQLGDLETLTTEIPKDSGEFYATLPLTFPEDYNGGSVTVDWKIFGTENDYVSLWNSSGSTVVDTDCEEPIEECSVTVVSDITNTVNEKEGANAQALTFVHSGWTADVDGATWIWGDNPVSDPTVDEFQTFKKTFNWSGPVTSAVLDIASDNSYQVYLNGVLVGSDANANNFTLATQDNIDVLALGTMNQGENTLEVVVKNWATPNDSNPQSNPAGLLYKLVVTGTQQGCDQPPPPITECEVLVSDITNKIGGSDDPAVPVSQPYHSAWTAEIDGATWIWSEADVSDPVGETNESFTKKFNWNGPVSSAELKMAADNSYEVYLNGNLIASDATENNFGSVDVTDELLDVSTHIVNGENMLEFKVKNWAQPGGTADSNPAGLLYKLVIEGEEGCDEPEPDVLADITLCKLDDQQNQLEGWQLSLLGEKIDEIEVDSKTNGSANAVDSNVLPAGSYVAKATGTFKYRGGTNLLADARFSERLPSDANYGGPYSPWSTGNIGWLHMNDDNTVWGNVFSPAHIYYAPLTLLSDSSANFYIGDDQHNDNNGNVTVEIYQGYTGVTNEGGCVTFSDVPHGEYQIEELLQPGWENESGLNVVQVEGDTTFNVVNSEIKEGPEQPEEPNELLGSISGRLYNDVNNNSNDDGEPALAGRKVWLLTHDSPYTLRAFTVTDGTGNYEFENLALGTYYVCQELQDGWLQTQLNDAGLTGVDLSAVAIDQVVPGLDSDNPDDPIAKFCYEVTLTNDVLAATARNFGSLPNVQGVSTTNDPGNVLADTNPDGNVLAETGTQIWLGSLLGLAIIIALAGLSNRAKLATVNARIKSFRLRKQI